MTKTVAKSQFLAAVPFYEAPDEYNGDTIAFAIEAETQDEAVCFLWFALRDDQRLLALFRAVMPAETFESAFGKVGNTKDALSEAGFHIDEDDVVLCPIRSRCLRSVSARSSFSVRVSKPGAQPPAAHAAVDRDEEAFLAHFRDAAPQPKNEPMKKARKKSA